MITTDGKLQGGDGRFAGFKVAAHFSVQIAGSGRDAAQSGTEKRGTEPVDVDTTGVFRIAFPDLPIVGPVTYRVDYPNGALAALKIGAAGKPVIIDVATPLTPGATANPVPDSGKHLRLTGALVDAAAQLRPSGVALRIQAVSKAGAGEQTVFTATTDGNGNFAGEYPHGTWQQAWAEISAAPGVKLPVVLASDHTLPRRVLLVVGIANAPPPAICAGSSTLPRQPGQEELLATADSFSADKGGRCVNFTVPNRTVEEFLYTFIVRTTDPAIKGLVLTDSDLNAVPAHVVNDMPGLRPPQRTAAAPPSPSPVVPSVPGPIPTPGGSGGTGAVPPAQLRNARLRLDIFRNLGQAATSEAIESAFAQSAAADAWDQANAAGHGASSRAPLGPNNPIDWDAEPTFYQATTIAHGHLVSFKQVWKADGYSLGDLLYSLPLAPAQKKQIAIVDWERRESGTRSEELLATEQLAADLSRDRDILEIVNTTVEETMKGASAALTGGVAKSKGSSDVGRVLGVSGGGGGAASGAIQDSNRALAVSALQQLNDRTTQVASGLRSQRATVVQSVTQGESVRVETDTVANYNHCHAMTMEYFEVLRHFRVEHEVAGVSECLFVPLLMSPFVSEKVLRWRSALQARLIERRLLSGFDAIDRIVHRYEGADLPLHSYADEDLENLEGELTMEFSWVRPPDNDKGEFAADEWKVLGPFLLSRFDGALAAFTLHLAGRAKEERDRNFRENIMPAVIEDFVQSMKVRLGGFAGNGQFQDADLDATLVSRARVGVPLRISLRAKGALPRISRARIASVNLSVPKLTSINEARALVRSGSMRYRTKHREDFLFRNRRIDNDLAEADAVRIDTPLNREEMRDPREEDKEVARRLIAHLNENLEYYHRALWLGLDAARRFMLLDGILAPGNIGRSVASVVENRVVAVVGNSLVLPVAPGFRLEQGQLGNTELLQLYAPITPLPPVRLSLPTRGVFAEAVMGECNACEKIDDTRFWRWEESPIPGEAPVISPVSADSRATTSADLSARDFAAPMINLQNAPSAPDPTGLGAALSVIGAANLFRDVTGLEGNQTNAAAALAGALGGASAASEAATKAVERAADLQMQKQLSRDINKVATLTSEAVQRGDITREQASAIHATALRRVAGGSPEPQVTVQEFKEVFAAASDAGASGSFDGTRLTVDARPLPGTPSKTGAGASSAGVLGKHPPSNLPDFVPSKTFIAPPPVLPEDDPDFGKPDPALTSGRAFHESWGLGSTIQDVKSLYHLVTLLSAGPKFSKGTRIRLLTHAQTELHIPLFDNWPAGFASGKEDMEKLVISDEAFVRFLVGPPTDLKVPQGSVPLWNEITTTLLDSNAVELASKFGILRDVEPAEPVRTFIAHCVFVEGLDRTTFNVPFPPTTKATVTRAADFLVRKPQADLVGKLRRELRLKEDDAKLLVDELASALKQLGPFGTPHYVVSVDDLAKLDAALEALEAPKKGFRETLIKTQVNMALAIFDVRGCEIGKDVAYMEVVRQLLGCVEVTAPDMFLGWPNGAVSDVIVGSATDLEARITPPPSSQPSSAPTPSIVSIYDAELLPAMERWAGREFPERWEAATNSIAPLKEQAGVFFAQFLKRDRVLPVCELSAGTGDNLVRLYRCRGRRAQEHWLKSLWGKNLKGKVPELADLWDLGNIPLMPALMEPFQQYIVCSEPEYREHIRSTA